MLNCILYFQSTASQEEIFQGNLMDLKAFHISLALPIDSVNSFSKNDFFLKKIMFCNLYLATL